MVKINEREYLGDGVYVHYDGYHVVLDTERASGVSVEIFLDSQVLQSLENYIKRLKAGA